MQNQKRVNTTNPHLYLLINDATENLLTLDDDPGIFAKSIGYLSTCLLTHGAAINDGHTSTITILHGLTQLLQQNNAAQLYQYLYCHLNPLEGVSYEDLSEDMVDFITYMVLDDSPERKTYLTPIINLRDYFTEIGQLVLQHS